MHKVGPTSRNQDNSFCSYFFGQNHTGKVLVFDCIVLATRNLKRFLWTEILEVVIPQSDTFGRCLTKVPVPLLQFFTIFHCARNKN